MIKVEPETKKDFIHFICKGPITHKDYQKVVIPTVEKKVLKSSKLRVLCDMREMGPIQLSALWDDFKLGMHHIKSFERFATVGDQWWMGPLMKISGLIYRIKVKHFKSHELDAAVKWVHKRC